MSWGCGCGAGLCDVDCERGVRGGRLWDGDAGCEMRVVRSGCEIGL